MTNASLVTPEGMLIVCDTSADWPPQKVDDLIRASAINLAYVGPCTTVRVQDTYSSSCAASAARVGSDYVNYKATIYLKGVSSTFANQPPAQSAHEYGHAYTLRAYYLVSKKLWTPYLEARGLAGNPKLGTTYAWAPAEIAADDYRLLFGSEKAISQRPRHMNTAITDPRSVKGLVDWMAAWGGR